MQGPSAGAQAPEARNLASGVERMSRACRRADEIRSRLADIRERLEPAPSPSSAGQLKSNAIGLIPALHDRHDDLSELMEQILDLIGRIDRCVGGTEAKG
jgi:hypothetical protein